MPTDNKEVLRASRKRYAQKNHHRESRGEQVTHVDRTHAEFDPNRDGQPTYSDLTAFILGDPPIGRRAIDQRGAD